MNITILGTYYSLYSHVHHSYGLNDAFDRSVAHLLTVQQLSINASALQDSVQQKPLDQDDTAIATEATVEAVTEAAEGRWLAAVDSAPADDAAVGEAAEGRWVAADESLPADEAAAREAAEGRWAASHESLPADIAVDSEAAQCWRMITVNNESPPAASVFTQPIR